MEVVLFLIRWFVHISTFYLILSFLSVIYFHKQADFGKFSRNFRQFEKILETSGNSIRNILIFFKYYPARILLTRISRSDQLLFFFLKLLSETTLLIRMSSVHRLRALHTGWSSKKKGWARERSLRAPAQNKADRERPTDLSNIWRSAAETADQSAVTMLNIIHLVLC